MIQDMKAETTLRVKNIYVKRYNIGFNVGVLMFYPRSHAPRGSAMS
jgi:hypothetical protein